MLAIVGGPILFVAAIVVTIMVNNPVEREWRQLLEETR